MDPQLISLVGKYVSLLIPVLVPLMVAAWKRWLVEVPKVWYPVMALALGAGIDVANLYLTGDSLGAQWGAVLGAAGIGVRELFDQLRKGLMGDDQTPPSTQ